MAESKITKSTYRQREDAVLDDIHKSLTNLGTNAANMGSELDTHNKILIEIDESAEETGDGLIIVNAKTKNLLARSKRCCWPWGAIALLVFMILILLIILIFG